MSFALESTADLAANHARRMAPVPILKAMSILRMVAFVFGCHHRHYSFPQTDMRTGRITQTCNDCGAVFRYDWREMRRGERIHSDRETA